MTTPFPKPTTLILALLMVVAAPSMSNAQWPYNPNADGDTLIGTGDVLQLLTLFGLPWEDEGVLGIESGGTGASSADSARVSLGISYLSDSTTTVGINSYVWSWAEGRMRITEQLAQGRNVTATGSFASALGDGADATGQYSHAIFQWVDRTVFTLQTLDRLIGVNRYQQTIAFSFGLLQVRHMTFMQYVETAIGHHQALTTFPRFARNNQRLLT